DGNVATVTTTIASRAGGELPVEYQMIAFDERWAVYDIRVDGISIVDNYRAQFARILRQSSYRDLVAQVTGRASEASSDSTAARGARTGGGRVAGEDRGGARGLVLDSGRRVSKSRRRERARGAATRAELARRDRLGGAQPRPSRPAPLARASRSVRGSSGARIEAPRPAASRLPAFHRPRARLGNVARDPTGSFA